MSSLEKPTTRAPSRSQTGWCALALVALCWAPGALAQPAPRCDEGRLRVAGSLAESWREATARLCEMLATMDDADPSARLQLVPAGEDLIVEVTLGDGRATLRRVHSHDDLLPTVEALVALPRSTAAGSAEPPAPREPLVVAEAPAGPVTGVELGGGLMGRLAGRTSYLSLGIAGYAGYRVGAWLLGVGVRWDGYQTRTVDRPPQLEMSTAGGGLLLLHRLRSARSVDLDLGGATWLLSEMQTRGEGDLERGGNTFDVRMGALARLLLGHGALRAALSLDFELSPVRLVHEERLADNLPLMPSWSLGLGSGVAWMGKP